MLLPSRLASILILSPVLWLGLVCGGVQGTQTNVVTTRVVVVEDTAAVRLFEPDPEVVAGMVARAIKSLTGQPTTQMAWRSIVLPTDVVGIKVYTAPGQVCGTRLAVTAAVIEGLLGAGLNPTNIIVWDKRYSDLQAAGFTVLTERYSVRVKGALESGYDESVSYENQILGTLMWGDLEFGKRGEVLGRNSYLTKLLATNVTKIITISPLLNNHLVGVAGHLYSLALGSVDNTARFEVSAERLATAIPEIYALPALSDRVVLSITDGLICQFEGGQRCLLHYSSVLNQLWFSRDPVALDVLAVHELDRQRHRAGAPARKLDLTLYQNATLLELGESDTNKIEIVRLH